MTNVIDLLDRWKSWEARKAPWLPYYQELGDLLLPNKSTFVAGIETGMSRVNEIFDGYPRLAARSLSSTIDGLLKPKTQRWFWIKSDDDQLNEDTEAKLWFEDSQERLFKAMYRKTAKFTQRSGEVDESLVVFGTGALWIGENEQLNGFNFKSFHLNNFCFEENGDGEIDQFGITEHLTPMQAIQKYGESNVHPEMIKLAREEKSNNKKYCFVQVILPRDDRDTYGLFSNNKEFASVTIDVTHKHKVRDSGYEEFPVAVPRWDTSPGEIYGRSPGMMALPDSKTLQSMGKTLLVGGQKAVDPPFWVIGEAALSPVRTFPGGFTVIDAELAEATRGQPMGVLDMGKNIPLGREMQEDYRRQVDAAFYKNVFNLPVEGPQMTATEIRERKEEYIRTIGPVFGRLESDYIGHIVERCFMIMLRAGGFAPLPDVLKETEANIKFEYLSPIQQARKQAEAAGLAGALELIGPLAQAKPEMLDRLNGDRIAKDMPEWAGVPQDWITNDEQYEQIQEQRAEQIQAQQALEAGTQAAPAIKDVAAAADGPGLGGLIEQLGAGQA